MDAVYIKITPDLTRMMRALGDDIEGGMHAGMTNVVETVLARSVKRTPIRTSNLVNAETSEVSPSGDHGRVFTDNNAPYAIWVHEGTGIFGPEKRRITPKNAKALRIPGVGYRKSTAGMKGTPFFQLALDESDPGALFEEGMVNYLSMRGWTS